MHGLLGELIAFAVIVLIIAAICILPGLGRKNGNQTKGVNNSDDDEAGLTPLTLKDQKSGTKKKRDKRTSEKSDD